jgi:hypothetical protein
MPSIDMKKPKASNSRKWSDMSFLGWVNKATWRFTRRGQIQWRPQPASAEQENGSKRRHDLRSLLKSRYTLGPTRKLSRHLFVWVWSWSDNRKFNFRSGHGSLNMNIAQFWV